jgi:hypothetical protein
VQERDACSADLAVVPTRFILINPPFNQASRIESRKKGKEDPYPGTFVP